MINERRFASQFSTFWRSALPNLESVVRSINLGYNRVEDRVSYQNRSDRRDVISETGFRYFKLRMNRAEGERRRLIEQAYADSVKYLAENTDGEFHQAVPLDDEEVKEIDELASRLIRYIQFSGRGTEIKVSPLFPGHGFLDACEGDILLGDNIVEIKYVDRHFRSTDLRQVLTYAALSSFSLDGNIRNVTLLNPFLGIEFSDTVSGIIFSASGRKAEEFFADFSYLVSSGDISR